MTLTIALARTWESDPLVQWKKVKLKGRRRRAVEPLVVAMSAQGETALEEFLNESSVVGRYPLLDSWDPFGRPWFLRDDQLDQATDEVSSLLAEHDVSPSARAALEELRALARRARAEGLVMGIIPD